jgi:hypothetical protein
MNFMGEQKGGIPYPRKEEYHPPLSFSEIFSLHNILSRTFPATATPLERIRFTHFPPSRLESLRPRAYRRP